MANNTTNTQNKIWINFLWKYIRWHFIQADSIYRQLTIQTNGNLFCLFFNFRAFLSGKDVRFSFDKNEKIYTANSKKYRRYFYAKNQNYNCYINGIAKRGIELGNVYFCPQIKFEDNDLVIDCGANVGDLKIYFEENNLKVRYVGIEPSPKEFFCLNKNVSPSETHNIGLWSEDSSLDFYVSSHNADSSFIQPQSYTEKITIPTQRLDSLFDQPVKLLKIEAEGAEPEALIGCERLLKNVEYISADLGFERGITQESTLPSVTNFLLRKNFDLIAIGFPRVVALYKKRES